MSLLLFSLKGSPVDADFLLSSAVVLSSEGPASSMLSVTASAFAFAVSVPLVVEVVSSKVTVLAVSGTVC